MELVMAALVVWLLFTIWWGLGLLARVAKLEWWVSSLENRKANKDEREVLEGDEWKHRTEDDE